MSYVPNINDSRVKSRIEKALNFVELHARVNEPRPIASSQLYKHFGNTSKPLGAWLVENLLIVSDSYYNMATGICKKYTKNSQGIDIVKQLIGLDDFVPKVPKEITDQIISGDFQYEEKSDRYFSPAQYIPKQYRDSILNNHGYRYHYDINAAAPRLLVQRAKQIQTNKTIDNPKYQIIKFDCLEYYINNRSQVRQQLSKECEITENQVKTVVNAILQGGIISSWTNNKIFMDLNYNYDAVKKLNHNDTIINLKSDIKNLWDILREELPQRYMLDNNGKNRRCRLSGSDKSAYYRLLEKQVADVIRKILKKYSVRYLWIHDGWCCDKMIDPNVIVNEVRRQTGFVIELDWTIYEE